jgi:hypothetical protein
VALLAAVLLATVGDVDQDRVLGEEAEPLVGAPVRLSLQEGGDRGGQLEIGWPVFRVGPRS